MDFDCKPERAADTLEQDAVAGLRDDLAETQIMLNSRYNEIKSGKVKLIPGEEAFAQLRERIQTRSSKPTAKPLEP